MDNRRNPQPRDHHAYDLAMIISLLVLLLLLFLLPSGGDQCCNGSADQDTAMSAAEPLPAGNENALAPFDQEADWPGCDAVLSASYVAFESGSGRLTEKGARLLDRLVVCLKDGNYRIVGHTDSQGDEQSNRILSQQRAESVMAYLIGKGIDPERLSTEGAGETDPIASNDTEAGRARNRRIEFIRLP